MRYTVVYKKTAVKDIEKLTPQVKKRIKAKLEFFYQQSGPLVFAQALSKPTDAQYRFRIGNYRVLFDADEDALVILRIQHRREVYRKQ
jgi:mRNA interferase RelE/StbE